jgi:hypothetical protein
MTALVSVCEDCLVPLRGKRWAKAEFELGGTHV